MTTRKIIFFDFDGVLVDSFGISYQSHKASHGTLSQSQYKKLFLGNIYKHVKPNSDNGDTFFRHYGFRINKLKPVPGTKKMLASLSKAHQMVIVSSTAEDILVKFLKKHKLKRYFSDILGKNFNPSKIIKINFILNKYRVSKNNCLFITDTVGDIGEAKKCGIRSIAVTWGFHSKFLLRKYKPLAIVTKQDQLAALIKSFTS